MSKLQELIEKLCPNGVEFKPLGEISNIKRGVRVVKSQLKESGEIPVYQNSLKPLGYYKESNFPCYTAFVIGGGAAGDVGFSDVPMWGADDCYSIVNTTDLNSKFAFYFLQANQAILKSQVRKASVPRLSRTAIEKLLIPVPPIEVQEEIVKILDRFAEYAAELQAELQARKEQYEYYRNLLLTFNPSAGGSGTDDEQEINVTTWGGHSYKIEWKTLGEICKVLNAPKKLNKKDYCLTGGYPIIDQGQDYIVAYTDDKEALLPSNQYVLFGDHTRNIKFYNGEFAQGADGLKILVSDESILPKFLYYSMKVIKIENRGYNRHWSVVSPLIIPVPPLELQEKIVSILDRFEELTTDLTNGLPAEIAAVKEQYEYYRNKLLTFKKLA